MLNYWWVTRPKRKLNSIPEVLAAFADLSLNEEWDGQRNSHLAYEDALEQALKALLQLTEGNRLVGIISHVSELKDQIDKKIIVTKQRTPDGVSSFAKVE